MVCTHRVRNKASSLDSCRDCICYLHTLVSFSIVCDLRTRTAVVHRTQLRDFSSKPDTAPLDVGVVADNSPMTEELPTMSLHRWAGSGATSMHHGTYGSICASTLVHKAISALLLGNPFQHHPYLCDCVYTAAGGAKNPDSLCI